MRLISFPISRTDGPRGEVPGPAAKTLSGRPTRRESANENYNSTKISFSDYKRIPGWTERDFCQAHAYDKKHFHMRMFWRMMSRMGESPVGSKARGSLRGEGGRQASRRARFWESNGRRVFENGDIKRWRCPVCAWWRDWSEDRCCACGLVRDKPAVARAKYHTAGGSA